MDMIGERRIEAPRTVVFAALNDTQVLRASIPGCESVEREGADKLLAKVTLKIGPVKATFSGVITLSDLTPPESYTISGEGQGGIAGHGRGSADVRLEAVPGAGGQEATLLHYTVRAEVGGKIAQLGSRLIDSTAKKLADDFFSRFAQIVAPDSAAQSDTATQEAAASAGAQANESVETPENPAAGAHKWWQFWR